VRDASERTFAADKVEQICPQETRAEGPTFGRLAGQTNTLADNCNKPAANPQQLAASNLARCATN